MIKNKEIRDIAINELSVLKLETINKLDELYDEIDNLALKDYFVDSIDKMFTKFTIEFKSLISEEPDKDTDKETKHVYDLFTKHIEEAIKNKYRKED